MSSAVQMKDGRQRLESDPLDLIQRDRIAAPVIETSCAGASMSGHGLDDFQLAAVVEVGAGRSEAMCADLSTPFPQLTRPRAKGATMC